ncbi:MAG: tRNA glutamyl-Q(34) synthetase GluQRS [Xanthomonadales bacterium]|nr:tRNA glutamyl-Q(34) synthetase GluQRS [Xanthomonadales bacterium]MDH4018946.1 tRNA glutamyl-Q(34) synthetase GluQRS [Xanthomonadales bacterium]
MNPLPVVGRFAPSPTGDLHFGSLVSAVGSYLEARSAGGLWLLRIEDIDPPREIKGSSDRIIHDLNRLGLVPDGPILYQSSRRDAYQRAVERLLEKGLAYPCGCSRKDLSKSGKYPGNCRNGIPPGKKPRSIRFRVEANDCAFEDRLQGPVSDNPADISGDFIIKRADGLFAYQLAVVVDDDFQRVTQVVRGADLLDSTSRQICLQRALGLDSPSYMHLPVVISADGKKLSKRTQSDPVKHHDPATAVEQALLFLGQCPPSGLSLSSLWNWALDHWNINLIPGTRTILPDNTLSV